MGNAWTDADEESARAIRLFVLVAAAIAALAVGIEIYFRRLEKGILEDHG